MSRVFLTGGGGYIGGQLADALVARGDDVIALARSDDAARALDAKAVTVVRGDVCALDTFADALAGCEIVHHVAGINATARGIRSGCGRSTCSVPRTSCTRRRAIGCRASCSRPPRRRSARPRGRSGATSPHRGSFLSGYERSKHDGERAAFAAAEAAGVGVVALNPTSVQGPPRAGGTAAIILAYLNGRLRAFVDTHVSIVDVQDVVAAHLLAESRGEPGRRYVLSDEALTSRQALQLLADLSATDRRVRFVPRELARRAAQLADLAFRARGRTSPMCSARVATILHGHRYDGSLATRELGLSYTPVVETFRRTIAWARDEGLVSAR